MEFDNKGNLVPYKVLTSNLNEIVNEFCFTEQRTLLYQNFVALIAELQTLLGIGFEVWVNGSFISKKPVPNDIDLVVFVDFVVFEQVEKQLEKFRTLEYRKVNFLDCYFVRKYPKEHKNYFRYEFDRTEYLHLFGKNRKKQEKGFLSIFINS
jgi:hypothetical protein